MEPLSAPLQDLLFSCRLCSPADLKGCQWRVRRLVRDLPAFDSVWIDALLQAGVVTSYQARVLESDDPSRLKVAGCVVRESLGGGEWSETCVADELAERRRRLVLKRLVVPSDMRAAVLERLESLVSAASASHTDRIVAPRGVHELPHEIVLLSPLAQGPSVKNLLIRRGRFPVAAVSEMAVGLVEGLTKWHTNGLVHGELAPGNVKVLPSGEIVAVDAGVQSALESRLLTNANRSGDSYEGVAPERVRDGGSATPESDLYSLGCLLFQMLAGRPAFPLADPVMKLNAHQSQHIPDVREWAPDTPVWLAECIQGLCSFETSQRQVAASEVLSSARPTRGTSATKRFLRRWESAAPALVVRERAAGRFGKLSLAGIGTATVLGLAATAWWGLGGQSLPMGLQAGTNVPRVARTDQKHIAAGDNSDSDPGASQAGWHRRPEDGAWVPTGPWSGGDVHLGDDVAVVVDGGGRTVSIGRGSELVLQAPRVELRNVVFCGAPSSTWITARCSWIRLVDCQFVSRGEDGAAEPRRASSTGVAMAVSDPRGHGGVMIEWDRGVTCGVDSTIKVDAPEVELVCRDVLQVGGRELLRWSASSGRVAETETSNGSLRGRLHMRLDRVTLRRSRHLLTWYEGDVDVDVAHSVLSIRHGTRLCVRGTPRCGNVRVRGRETILTPGVVVADGDGTVEGVVAGLATFRGRASRDARDSVLSRRPVGVPGMSGHLPGIRPESASRLSGAGSESGERVDEGGGIASMQAESAAGANQDAKRAVPRVLEGPR